LDFANFSDPQNMNRDDLTFPVAAAATSQVKLCPYDEEEPHIWFRLIEAQFAAARVKSQKLKYANALASLPKQVLRDILDTIDVCNGSHEPFDFLKNTLLGQFGKSKWQSYFEFLRLPMEMQGSSPVFSWESSNKTSHQEPHLTMTFFWQCLSSSSIHERDSRSWRPWDSHSHGEGCGTPYGTLGAATIPRSQPP
jgi:hypothetical protein